MLFGTKCLELIGAVLVVFLVFFQPPYVENIVGFTDHAPDVLGREAASLHRVDDISTSRAVAPRLGKQGRKGGIVFHDVRLLYKSWERRAHFLGPS